MQCFAMRHPLLCLLMKTNVKATRSSATAKKTEWPWLEIVKKLISYIARWKARGQFPIHNNWTFCASTYGWDVISRCWLKSALFSGWWLTLTTNFRWHGTSPHHCWLLPENVECLKAAWSYLHSSEHSTRWTDRVAVANTALSALQPMRPHCKNNLKLKTAKLKWKLYNKI